MERLLGRASAVAPLRLRRLSQEVPGGALDEGAEAADPRQVEPGWSEYWENNRTVYIILGCSVVLFFIIWYKEMAWRRQQRRRKDDAAKSHETHEYAVALVTHLMPSFRFRKFQFRGMAPKAETVALEFEDLSLELKDGKTILQGVSGSFEAGKMCAIMGPSGAGKTTFMNTLCGKATYGNMGGQILINGRPANVKTIRSVTGFVPQDDVVFEDLTVREQIHFSARLRNDVSTSDKVIDNIVNDVLHIMQIDHIQGELVGGVGNRGISGGQRKRVNIGLELAAQPTLLFLDEPTSGLDSTSSLAIALSLKTLCKLGVTSIMVIHQPRYSLYTLFDKVLLLGKGGRTVYLGPSVGSKAYFEHIGFEMPENENPADWFMDVISGEMKNKNVERFKPEMLFQMWLDHQGSFEQTVLPRQVLRTRARSSELINTQDRAVLGQALEEEWDHFDADRSGEVDLEELDLLLEKITSQKASEAVLRELMDRMAGPDREKVSKSEFLNYLNGLSEDVAMDLAVESGDSEEDGQEPLASSGAGLSFGKSVKNIFRRNTKTKTLPSSPESEESSSSSDDSDLVSDSSETNVRRGHTLSRRLPGYASQFSTLWARRMLQFWRMRPTRITFLGALLFAASFFAVLDRYLVVQQLWDADPILYLHTALALLMGIFALHTFGSNQPLFWRERDRGLNTLAYYMSSWFSNFLDIFIMTVVYSAIYYIIRQPCVPFCGWVVPNLLVALTAAAWGQLISLMVKPGEGPFFVTLLIFVTCGLLGEPVMLSKFLSGDVAEIVVSALSITRWSVSMAFVNSVQHLQPNPTGLKNVAVYTLQKDVYFRRSWIMNRPWMTGFAALLVMNLVLRVATFLMLKHGNRKKMI